MPKDNKNKKEKRHFLKDFKAELRKVIWPTPKQLANNTVAVITIVIIVAIIVFALDFTFEKLNTYGINKIKSMVETTNSINETTNSVNEETNANEVANEETNTNEVVNSETQVNEVAE